MKRVLCVVLLLAMLLTLLTGCGAKQRDIRQLLSDFETACHEMNVEGMLDCIDPKVSDKVRVMFGIIGSFSDSDSQKIMEYISTYLLKDGSQGSQEFFTSVTIEPDEIKLEEDTATVTAIVSYKLGGEEIRREAVFECIYYTEQWYIADFSQQ